MKASNEHPHEAHLYRTAIPLRPISWVLCLAAMAAAYSALAVESRALFIFHHYVHESGARSLLQTIFYFEHAMRELPLDLFLAVALGAGIAAAHPRGRTERPRVLVAVGLVAAVLLLIFVGTYLASGWSGIVYELGQSQTRPGHAARFGGHWQYHLLSRLAVLLLGFAIIGFTSSIPTARQLRRILERSLLVFVFLTVFFRPQVESLIDARYLGHQARELMTHSLVTIPALLFFGLPKGAGLQLGRLRERLVHGSLLAATLIGLWLALGVILTSAADEAQEASWAKIIAGHFFEHSLSYLLVPAVAFLVRHGLQAKR